MFQEVVEASVLRDVTGPECFWTNSGTVIRNMYDLAGWIEVCSEAQFGYHCNESKDDFAQWIAEVVGDEELAKKLKGVYDKERYAKIIRKRLEKLF